MVKRSGPMPPTIVPDDPFSGHLRSFSLEDSSVQPPVNKVKTTRLAHLPLSVTTIRGASIPSRLETGPCRNPTTGAEASLRRMDGRIHGPLPCQRSPGAVKPTLARPVGRRDIPYSRTALPLLTRPSTHDRLGLMVAFLPSTIPADRPRCAPAAVAATCSPSPLPGLRPSLRAAPRRRRTCPARGGSSPHTPAPSCSQEA